MSSRRCKACAEFFSVKLPECPHCGTPYEQPRQPAKEARPFVCCDTTGCEEHALMRVGNANLCPRCYAQHHVPPKARQTNNQACNEIRAAFARSHLGPIAAEQGMPAARAAAQGQSREPGSDDELIAA